MLVIDLPDDVLELVLEFLPTLFNLVSVSAVCRTLRAVVYRSGAFQVDLGRVDNCIGGGGVLRRNKFEEFGHLIVGRIAAFEKLHVISLVGFHASLDDDGILHALNRHGAKIVELRLNESNIESPVLDCPLLSVLSLVNCRKLTRIRIPQSLAVLSELNLSRTFTSDADLVAVLPKAPNLRVLRLRSCKNVRTLPFDLNSVRLLELSNTAITDKALRSVLERAPRLEVLFAADCHGLRRPVLDCCGNLRTLSMRNCANVVTPTIEAVQLRELDLGGTVLSDAAFHDVIDALPELRVLSLVGCWELVDLCRPPPGQIRVVPPVDLFGTYEARTCTFSREYGIERLDVSQTGIYGGALMRLVRRLPHLATLCMAMMRNAHLELTVAGELTWYAANLKHLNVNDVALRDVDFQGILAGSPRLQRLDARRVLDLRGTVEWIDKMHVWSTLLSLDISDCTIGDQALLSLWQSCPALTTAKFEKCCHLIAPAVTSVNLVRVSFMGCRALCTLFLVGCERLHSIDMKACAALEHIEVIRDDDADQNDADEMGRVAIPDWFCVDSVELNNCPAAVVHELKRKWPQSVRLAVNNVSVTRTAVSVTDDIVVVADMMQNRPVTPPLSISNLRSEVRDMEVQLRRQWAKRSSKRHAVLPHLRSLASSQESPSSFTEAAAVAAAPRLLSAELLVLDDRIEALDHEIRRASGTVNAQVLHGLQRRLDVLKGRRRIELLKCSTHSP